MLSEIEQVLPSEIEKRSFEIITEELKEMGKILCPETELIVKRCIHTSADFEYADSLVFTEGVVEKAKDAIRRGVPIITDTQMGKAGNKRWARVVGYALHVNPDPEGIPCYRVVNREGRVSEAFAFGGENRQIGLLEADGIEVKDGCVDLSKYQWRKEIF